MLKRYPHIFIWIFIFMGLAVKTTDSKAFAITRDVLTIYECEKRASIRVRNGVAPYTYVWSYGGNVIQTDTGLGESDLSTIEQAQAGNYTLTVTDSNGNTYSEVINFAESTNFILNILNEEEQECEGETFGTVYGTIENGIAPFTVNFYDEADQLVLTEVLGGRNLDLNGVPAGKYLVEVIDATGCKELTEVEIEEIAPLEIAPGSATGTFPETCEANGGVIFNASDYVGATSFRIRRANGSYATGWLPAPSGEVRYDQLVAGDYVLEVIDDYRFEDCPEEIAFNIGNEILLEITPTTSPITCFGDTDGEITLDVNRVFMGFAYPPAEVEVDIINPEGTTVVSGESISIGATSGEATFPGFGGGLHTIIIRHGGDDYPECTLTYEAMIESPAAPLTASVNTTPVTCFGDDDGTARVNRSDGWGGYSYLWSDGQTGRTATDLAPGDYTVTVTDFGGCSLLLNVTIVGPAGPIDGNVEVLSPLTCVGANDGSARVFDLTGGWGTYTYLWSNGETTPTAYNLPAGTNTVLVTDLEGCAEEFSVDVPVPDAPLVTYTPTEPTCFGGSDGTLRVQIADPYTGFEVTVNGETQTGNDLTFTGLPGGQQQVSIAYSGICNITEFVDIGQPAAILIDENNLNISPVLCAGDGNGSISGLAISGGTGALSSQWQQENSGSFVNIPGQTSLLLNNLSGGTYRLVVTDENGCSVYRDYVLDEPTQLQAGTPTVMDVTCAGGFNGSVSFTVSGGTVPYTYSLNGGSTVTTSNNNITISGLGAGLDNFIVVRDANNCAVPNLNFDITAPPAINITNPIITPENCFGQENGSITVDIGGGSGNLGIEWFESGDLSTVISTDQNLTNKGPGQYVLRVSDLDFPSCFSQENFTIPPTAELNLALDGAPINVLCFGESTGAINIEVEGGTGNFTYQWTGPSGFTFDQEDATGLASGLYNVRVTDENGCWKQLVDIPVSQPASAISINVLSTVEPKCHDSTDGRIEIQAGGGNAPYTVGWEKEASPGMFLPVSGSSLTLSNIESGTYKALVTDANNCNSEEIITLNAPDPLEAIVVDKENVSCFGRNDGSIALSVTGGTGVYFFNWDHGFVNQNPTNLGEGTYGVTVTDAFGCSFRLEDIEITQPDELAINLIDLTAPSCGLDDGSIEVEFLGGDPFLSTNRWIDLSVDTVLAENQSLVSGLHPGFYRVEYSVGGSCAVNRTFNVPGPSSPLNIVTNSQDADCPGDTGFIFLSANGGVPSYQFFIFKDGIWEVATNSILAGLPMGTYDVRVDDAAGCQDFSTITIDEPDPPYFDVEIGGHVSCFGGSDGSIIFSMSGGTGGYSLQWFRKTPFGGKTPITVASLDALIAGTYYMEITYSGGCVIASPDYTITEPDEILINPSVVQPVCEEDLGSFSIAITGGSPGKRLQLTSPNGYSRVYDDEVSGTFLFDDLAAGDYTWTLEDQGCPDQSDTFTIDDILKPQFNISTEDVSCFGSNDGSIEITDPLVHGGRTFSVWINGVNQGIQTDFFNLGPGVYQVRIQDSMGCQSDPVAVTITQPDRPLEITNIAIVDPSCFGALSGEISFEIIGGRPLYRAVLTPAVGVPQVMDDLNENTLYDFAALEAGTFTLEVWDHNDVCQISQEITLSQPGPFTTSLEVGEIFCEGGATYLELTTTGGVTPYTFTWEKFNASLSSWELLPDDGNRINNATAGAYRYTVQETNGCALLTDTIDIPDGNPISIDYVADDILCFGGTVPVTLAATSLSGNGFTYFVNGAQIFGNEFMAQAGSYVAYAVDNINGCVSEDLLFDISQPAAPFAIEDYNSGDLTCFESGDGSLSLTLMGGTAPYSITFLGNTFTAVANEEVIFENLSANISYEIEAVDANGCTFSIPPMVLSQPLPLQASANFDPIVCYGGSTDINLQVSGGTSPYSVSWTYSEDGLDEETIPGSDDLFNLYDVAAGFYTYTISDGGCVDIVRTIEIDQPDQVLLSSSAENVSCFGGSDGSIAFSPSGGSSANYRIFLNGLEITGNSAINLSAGTYTAFAMSGTCRSENVQVIITQPATPLSGNLTFPAEVLCHNDLSEVSLQVSGGTASYTAYLDGVAALVAGTGMVNFGNVVTGDHTIRVVDAMGCEWTEDFSIFNPEPIEIYTEDIINVSCFEGDNGEVRVLISGGTGAYTYQWLDVNGVVVGSNRNLIGVPAGNYNLTVRDENNCEVSEDFEITAPGLVGFNFTTRDVSCFGGQNGRIEVVGNGGTPGYQLVVNGIQYPTLSASGLVAGNYIVYVLDAVGCSSPVQEIIIKEPLPLNLAIDISDVSCYTANNGEVAVEVSGGTGPYNIRWSDGNLSMNRTGMAPGNYELVVNDANGCIIRENVIITQPDPVLVDPIVSDVSCFEGSDGRIMLEISGGNGSFDVLWESVATGAEVGNGLTVQDLSAGVYRATISDEEGCELIREYEVLQPTSPLSVEPIIIDVRCIGESRGSIDLIVTGGTAPYTYSWSSGETSRAVQNKAGGTYQVEVRDSKGCTLIQVVEIEEPDPIEVQGVIEDVSCKFGMDGSIDLAISGGTGNYQVQWSNGMSGASLNNVRAGIYTAFVIDAASCFESYTFTVNEPEEQLSISGVANSELCFFDDVIELLLTVDGGSAPYTYAWSNGATSKDLIDITPGIYSVVVTDANGCFLEETFDVPPPSSPMDLQLTGKFGICNNGERGDISVTVNGGQAPYSFLWSNGATTSSISDLNPGTYRLEVTDARGCFAEETIEIIRPRDLNVSLEEINGVSCFGANDGHIQIAVYNNDSPFSISWSNGVEGQLSISNLAAGLYTASITDSVGCITTVAYQIREPEALTFYEFIEDITCHGDQNGAVVLEVRGGTAPYSYQWSNGATSRMIRNLDPGTYSVLVTDRMGCSTGGEFRVAEPEVLSVEVSQSEILACYGDENGFINLNISGGVQPYRVTWSDRPELGTQNRNGLPSGSYTVMVADDNNCSQVLTIEIEEPPLLEANLSTRFDVDCENEIITVEAWIEIEGGAGDEYEIVWNNGATQVTETTYLEDGLISVIISDENGCRIELSSAITMPLAFTDADFTYAVISTGIQGEILINDPVQFNDQTLGNVFTWEWDFGDGEKSNEQNPVHQYPRPGTYTINLTTFDVFGCISETSITVEVVASYRILVPNAFSPNGDGLNDTFFPKIRGIDDFELYIFNKWGELVYSAFSLEDPGWDGILNGKMSPNGNYVYKIRYKSVEGEEGSKTGVFTLVL